MRPIHFKALVVATVIMVGVAFVSIYQAIFDALPSAIAPHAVVETDRSVGLAARAVAPDAAAEAERDAELPADLPNLPVLSPASSSEAEFAPTVQDKPAIGAAEKKLSKLEEKDQARLEEDVSARERSPAPMASKKRDLSYLRYYIYSELPPTERPADVVLESLKGVPVGIPVEEIKHASAAFGVNFSFMKAVAKIESDFDPKQRTGSYIGLFQLSNYEFKKYGSGEITSARDNAVAAAWKFLSEAALFEWETNRKPTFSDLYLIHQQGWQGAAEHVSHPERIAWKSMCATDEGREKGEKWCKRAVWGNTLPIVKHVWKSVDNMTSAAFVTMWRERVDRLYSRYSEAAAADVKH